jgi:aspartyl protease family protein
LLPWLALSAGLALTSVLWAVAPVEVVGLFKNQAVIKAPGGAQRLLKVGQVSPEGVRLLSANTREAVIEYLGERHTLSLSNRVSSGFREAERASVTIPSDQLGQYRVRGAINDHYVNFLVDTGASVVALSSQEATRLGIDYSRGERGQVQTAQGTTDSFFLILDEVKVAGLKAYNVQAAVIEGAYPVEILLGMSFLRQVSMQEQAGAMVLTQKF